MSHVALVVKNSPANAGGVKDMGWICGSRRYPGGGHGSPLQYSCLENPLDRGAWWAIVHRAAKNQTRLKQLSTHTHLTQCLKLSGSTSSCVSLSEKQNNKKNTDVIRLLENCAIIYMMYLTWWLSDSKYSNSVQYWNSAIIQIWDDSANKTICENKRECGFITQISVRVTTVCFI